MSWDPGLIDLVWMECMVLWIAMSLRALLSPVVLTRWVCQTFLGWRRWTRSEMPLLNCHFCASYGRIRVVGELDCP